MKDGMVKTTQIVDVQAYEKTMSLGICLGASTISVVQLEASSNGHPGGWAGKNNGTRVVDFSVHYHGGDPKQTMMSVVNELDFGIFDKIAVTGRKFHKFVNLSAISEPEAVEHAFKFVKPDDVVCPAVVSAGGVVTGGMWWLRPSPYIAGEDVAAIVADAWEREVVFLATSL